MIRKFETLARIPLLRGVPPAEIERLDTQCVWRRAKLGDAVLDIGEGGADLYFVAHGKLRVTIQAISGRESILRDLGDGEFFGELAAIDGRPRSTSIVALTDAVVAKMPPQVFLDVVHRYASVCDGLLALLASQIRMLANRVDEFGKLDVRARIHAELLRLSRPDPVAPSQGVISPPPTHAELAARVSCRREAVTRELNALARMGLITRRRGALVLADPAALAQAVEKAQG
jgi:CRP/FNR family cyclic AMP-dependent transcriptional regulator